MGSVNEEEENFDLIQPTLIQQIKKILDQYPDDGQILKELIQNAEDAEATEVKILYDHHSHKTTKLLNPELANFQGPALYAYNNAKFSAEDWKGVRMLCDSIKVKDPMKVGRFGLGFKSVFHMTDVPSVLSDDRLLMIDPHEKYLNDSTHRRTGKGWHLQKDALEIGRIPDQFAPYKGLFSCTEESFLNGKYDGTMFRFPLRQKASELSENLYTDEKVHGIFECFQREAPLMLLFMKSLESIELFERTAANSEPGKRFQVKIAESCLKEVRQKRRHFTDQVRQLRSSCQDNDVDPVKVTYLLTIETICMDEKVSSHTFMITQYYSGNMVSPELKGLILDESLSYMPWLGVALPLTSKDVNTNSLELISSQSQPQGHLFCFLPLPLEQKSLTGLPVHVNGFFALSQNRRHLKWPSADVEESGQAITDKSLLWNKCLLGEVLPEAYAELLMQMVAFSETREARDGMVNSQGNDALTYVNLLNAVYSAWPDYQQVDPKWKIILKPLFSKILYQKVLYSEVNGGKWLQLDDVILDKLESSDGARIAVNRAMLNAGQKVVTAPPHIITTVGLYFTNDVKEITPGVVRENLLHCPECYSSFDYNEKIALLKFILRNSNYYDLHGLNLLPLSNKTFIPFHNKKAGLEVYVPSHDHPKTLLLGLKEKFVDTSDVSVMKEFINIANSGKTQVCHFNKDAFASLLPQALPRSWIQNEQVIWDVTVCPSSLNPSKAWFESLWQYISLHFKDLKSLSRFQGLSLIPLTPLSLSPVRLAPLQRPSSFLIQRRQGINLPQDVIHMLRRFGLTIIEELPDYVSIHPALVPYFIKPPDPQAVVEALEAQFQTKQPKIQTSKDALREAQTFREYLCRARISDNQRTVLRKLPIFKTFAQQGGGHCELVCSEKGEGLTSNDVPPVPLNKVFLDLCDHSSQNLGKILGITQRQPMDLVADLLHNVQVQRFTGKQIDNLMQYVFQRLPYYSNQYMLRERLKSTSFVSVPDGQRKMAKELFDPEQQLLCSMFANENDKFPCKKSLYCTQKVVGELRKLDLKGENAITTGDILSSAQRINSMADRTLAREKSKSILQYLSTNPHMFSQLCHSLKTIPWVAVQVVKPAMYPNNLPLKCDSTFERPANMKGERFIAVVGSTKPIAELPNGCRKDMFEWNVQPGLDEVLLHLKQVIMCYDVIEKAAFICVVKEIYKLLEQIGTTQGMQQKIDSLGLSNWVWNGNGFSSPQDVVTERPLMDLSPYLCILPAETREHSQLFRLYGMKTKCDKASLLDVLNKIKAKHEEKLSSKEDTRRDLQIAVDILNELKPGPNEALDEEVYSKLLIPLDQKNEGELKFAPAKDCTYCDLEWLRQDYNTSDIDDEDELHFIHRNIPIDTASELRVPTLMSRMLDADELQLGESFGQHEPLTRRLNRLLEEYTDGFSVPKELIQNADDAGATEVRFLYDERTNEDAMTRLIDEGMKGCQGPALWSYNDAVFNDTDFQNIIKLNGATKKDDTGKIGRFGLGFNAVYNLTDVPSFVSRTSLVIFDPHTTYLGKGIRDKSKPGIKVDLRKKCRKLANQFKPYHGIFGCDLGASNENFSFEGTLFRFPLRTKDQARLSEIKALHYDNKEIKKLLQMLVNGAESLLLFTQNVCKVSIYHLPKDSFNPQHPTELVSISKSGVKIIRELLVDVPLSAPVQALSTEEQNFVKQCSILKASSESMKHKRDGTCKIERIESSMVIKLHCHISDAGREFLSSNNFLLSSETCFWLVTSNMVSGSALPRGSLIPTAGAAARLHEDSANGNFIPVPIKTHTGEDLSAANDSAFYQHNGRVFCFLPLPIHSGFPVHINGSFATDSSRRHLREKTDDDKSDLGADWNEILMREAVCIAYLNLIEDVTTILPKNTKAYQFYSLWPIVTDANRCFEVLPSQFYKSLCGISNGNLPNLFSDGKLWSDVSRIAFLHPDIRNDQRIGDTALEAFRVLRKHEVVIDMPANIFRSFGKSDCMTVMQEHCYNKMRVFKDVFLPAIESFALSSEMRDKLVIYALDDDSGNPESNLSGLLVHFRCIPVSPDGETLEFPKNLIHPNGKAATLFSKEDRKFPFGECYNVVSRLHKLVQLGMRSDDLEWTEIIERIKSVKNLNERKIPKAHLEALSRTKAILSFVDSKLEKIDHPNESLIEEIQSIEFLPILQKPNRTPFSWKSDDYTPETLIAPKDLHSRVDKKLVSVSTLMLDDTKDGCDYLTEKVKNLLRIKKIVTLEQVKAQLKSVIEVDVECQDSHGQEEIQKVCKAVYEYFHKNINENEEEIKTFLIPLKFILHGRRFLSKDQVAFKCDTDLSPFLHELPRDFIQEYPLLFRTVEVQEQFYSKDYVKTLQYVNTQFQGRKLDDKTLHVTIDITRCLSVSVVNDNVHLPESIYLPDSTGVMRKANELSVKDCVWMPEEEGINYVHDDINANHCIKLGVNTRREETLRKNSLGIPFGQKEELTTRLKRILQRYPFGDCILKELLQNADDAQATAICFIKDPRFHKDEKVFEESWKPLQGPALCVYNNSPFTKKDLKGIQSLGEGSKGDDPNKTGQYGVGFNAVYHLTDVPSFISKGEDIDEMMCVFDPHCKFVPGATKEMPGMAYNNLPRLKSIFSDIFPCYLGEHFPIDNSTMFRFPLRSEEMAEESKLSEIPMTMEKLDELMATFKAELFDSLLFVNNVTEISLCEIDDKSGKLCNEYKVTATLTNEDQRKRKDFGDYLKEVVEKLNNDSLSLSQISKKEISYVVNLEDTDGVSQQWFVVQRIGFDHDASIPECVSHAVEKKKLGLLPRGGVASLINSSISKETNGKAFCFLPLPIITGLPIHINGHFALDHEARRNLWRDDNPAGYRGSWNDMLLRLVVAPSYVSLLDMIRQYSDLRVSFEHCKTFNRNYAETLVNTFFQLFPSLTDKGPYWKSLAKHVYSYMDHIHARLLPVLRPVKDQEPCSKRDRKDSKDEQAIIEWFAPTGDGQQKAYFNNLICTRKKERSTVINDKQVKGISEPSKMSTATLSPQVEDKKCTDAKRSEMPLRANTLNQRYELYSSGGTLFSSEDADKTKNTLLALQFNLLEAPLSIFRNFIESGVEVSCISPEAVVTFFGTHGTMGQLCHVGDLPSPLEKTPFKMIKNLLLILKYCKEDKAFLQNLDGLPLLLTNDEVLTVFDSSNPSFLTTHLKITPTCSSQFVHGSLYKTFHTQENPEELKVFKKFDITAFSKLLPFTLESKFQDKHHHVQWNPEDKTHDLPSRKWVYYVWQFLSMEIDKVLNNFETKLNKQLFKGEISRANRDDKIKSEKSRLVKEELVPLQTWCLLPATITTEVSNSLQKFESKVDNFLVPLAMAETVIWLRDVCVSVHDIAFKDLFLPQINRTFIDIFEGSFHRDDYSKIALMVVASTDKPRSVLVSLSHKLQSQSTPFNLGSLNLCSVLEFFSANIKLFREADSDALKKLPFYLTVHGKYTSIVGKVAFVLPVNIPQQDMHIWEENTVFLRERPTLKDLHFFLGCKSKDEVDLYCDIIFPNFGDMSEPARIVHLDFLRMHLAKLMLEDQSSPKASKLRAALFNLEFIPNQQGELQVASSFYDPEHEVFEAMFQDSKKIYFPPTPFSKQKWLEFLRKIGLIHDVSAKQFVEFATEVEREARSSKSDATKKKSEVLLNHLFQRKNVATESLLQEIKDIRFIFPYKVDSSLTQLYPQHGKNAEGKLRYLCFNGSVVSGHDTLTWTNGSILPDKASPNCYYWGQFNMDYCEGHYLNKIQNYRNRIMTELGILNEPSPEAVISHCCNVCKRFNELVEINEPESSILRRVMEVIYIFLQNSLRNSACNGTVDRLKSIPCVLVEKGKRFVLPCQIVVEFQQDSEIRPYLYKVPLQIAPYHELFKRLGATERVNLSQYAFVLKKIFQNSRNDKLEPNEKTKAFMATKGLFEQLEKENKSTAAELSELYFPGTKRDSSDGSAMQIFMRQSNQLLCDNAPHFRERITHIGSLLLVRLDECGLQVDNDDRLVNKLPEKLKPRMLTSVVQEHLQNDSVLPQNPYHHNIAQKLMQILTSDEFSLGFARLVKNEDHETRKETAGDIIAASQKKLRYVKVYSVTSLLTHLVYQGQIIPGSEAEVNCFEERIEEDGSEFWNIYIKEGGDLLQITSVVAAVVNRITGHLLGKSVVYLSSLLQAPTSKIKSLLDIWKIREDSSSKTTSHFPPPGSFINVNDHHLLVDAFEDFVRGEYVGYEVDDPSLRNENGTPTYIYAIVIEEVFQDICASSFVRRKYRINIGEDREPEVVDGVNLYKFCRRVPGQAKITARKPDDLQETMAEVTRILEECWRQPKEIRDKIIKRLYLSWHPDKNPGNEEFCTKVFQHIQSEIARLSRPASYSSSGGCWHDFFYSSFYSQWTERAGRHRQQRTSFGSGFWSGGYCPNPQRGEARRWFRQAEADLGAVGNDIGVHYPAFEWACFKCHQAAEKALKAAKYSIDADKTNMHDLCLNAMGLGDTTISDLASSLEGLAGGSAQMRYPDCMRYPMIPHDMYNAEKTKKAYNLAKKILDRVKERYSVN